MLQGRGTLAAPPKKQHPLPAFYRANKSGSHHHANPKTPLEELIQRGQVANKIGSSIWSSVEAKASIDHQSKLQEQNEVRRKVAAAAQEREKLSRQEKQNSAVVGKFPESRSERDAWNERALAAARDSASKSAARTTLPGAAATRPRPSAPTTTRPHTSKQNPSVLSRLGKEAAKYARERRVRKQETRNERLRAATDDITDSQAQREAEENHALSNPPPYEPIRSNTVHDTNCDAKPLATPDDDELVLEPPTPPQDPFSLNSVAGVRAIQKSMPRPIVLPYDDVPAQSAAQRFMGTKPKISLKKSSRNQELLPITASDLQLYKWRGEGVIWADVIQMYSELTNTPPKRDDTLRARFRQVQKAIEVEEIPTEMCQQVINGDKEAEAELNRLVGLHAGLPVPVPGQAGPIPTPTPFKKILKQTPAARAATIPPPAPRPTQGGKTLNHDAYMLFMNHAMEAYASEDEDKMSLDGSPPAEEDCVHWEYFMERRDLASENIDEEYEALDEEVPWREYNAAFSHVGHANAEASKFILTVPDGTPEIFKPAEKWKLEHEPLAEGMSSWSMTSAYGQVQVRVGRRLLTFQDHRMPDTKEGWLPKTIYGVFVEKRKNDSLKEPEIEFYQLQDRAYGSLDQVNAAAMKEWLRLTFTSRTANLIEVNCKREEAKRELERELEDQGEGVLFRKSMDDDEKTIKVYVKPMGMQGARN